MTALYILIVIFSFIIILEYIGEKEKTKRTKMKIEAYLRDREMSEGYSPGTYSNVEERDSSSPHKMSREELKRAIRNLEERLENLDTILKARKYKEA